MSFVHLHVHSQYSLLEGAIHVESLIERVKALGMPAVALTDTHNLFGVVDFYLAAKDAGIKPIIGCELNVATPIGNSGAQSGTKGGLKFHHLVVLCKNTQGYENLCQMITKSYKDCATLPRTSGYWPKAWIDRGALDRYGDGLIVLSGCLRGVLAAPLIEGREEDALELALWLQKRFGEDFYFELQDSGIPEQAAVNETLSAWSEKYGIKTVATNDCHYLKPEDAEAHEILQCIEHGRNLDFDRPESLVPNEYYFKSQDEMKARFERFPDAYARTMEIAEKCQLAFKFKDEQGRPIYHLPKFRPSEIPPDAPFDLLEYFRAQGREGLKQRLEHPSFVVKVGTPGTPEFAERAKPYFDRLEQELAMIERTGFAGYFLIVSDFIGWAKKNAIPVGPGRGSGAGSLVAYSLKITDIDPIEYNLLFERFINPERISMPDFDVDFCQDRRGEVIKYVGQKYGQDNVCQIITFGKLQPRAVIKDVGRVLGLSFAESDAITKLLPDDLDITIERAIESEERLRNLIESDPKIATIIRYARSLEGLYRSAGMHAAGVIITEKPVVAYCPLYMGKDGYVVSQFDKDYCEKIGLIKFDFLGLKTLTVIDNAVKLIRETAEKGTPEFDLEHMNLRDPAVFALISSGDTDGVFQVESSGMKDLCMRIQPNSIEDLTAINALYRPGPLGSGMVDDFIERKHGRIPTVYEVESLESILRDTYGVILYQEQVMQIARELAGYSLGQADLLRRAMGKKKADEMANHRDIFVQGALKKQIPEAKAGGIFDLMAKFAEYGFNKSHSAAYAMLTYQTAYLKTHYSSEFMAALMTTEMDNTDKITKYINDTRSHGLPILSPDVNFSQKRFSVEWVDSPRGRIKGIRFGLEAIKGVGGVAVDCILEARLTSRFNNVLDFVRRVPTRKVNKKVVEALTLAGAFDTIAEVNRASVFASLETLLEHAGEEQEERELGQTSLFDSFGSQEVKLHTPPEALFKREEDWSLPKKLTQEKQVVGFYVSGHPMDGWQKICEQWLGWSTERLKKFAEGKAQEKSAEKAKTAKAEAQGALPGDPAPWGGGGGGGGRYQRAAKTEIKIAGLVSELREVTTKKGSRMAFGQLEDLEGRLEVVFFPESWAANAATIQQSASDATVLVLTCDLELGEEIPKLQVKSAEPAADAHKGRVQQVVVRLRLDEVNSGQLRDLKKSFIQFRGKCGVRLDFLDSSFKTWMDLPKTVGVNPSPQMVASVNKIFGRDDVVRLN
ncbi:DNA polymerase III subunit alpha [Bdellovibrionota bacterium FG-2]